MTIFRNNRGFTLLELEIGGALTALLAMALFSMLSMNQKNIEAAQKTTTKSEAYIVLDDITDQLRLLPSPPHILTQGLSASFGTGQGFTVQRVNDQLIWNGYDSFLKNTVRNQTLLFGIQDFSITTPEKNMIDIQLTLKDGTPAGTTLTIAVQIRNVVLG